MPLLPADPAVRDRVQTVWNELADFPLADGDAAVVHALRAFGTLVRATEGAWFAGVRLAPGGRDPWGGWRLRARRTSRLPQPDRRSRRAIGHADTALLTRCLRATTADAGHVCAARMDGRAICVTFRVTADAASSFLWAAPRQTPFTATDRDVLTFAVRGLKWFHRQALVSHGLLAARAPFTDAERAVLRLLLRHLSEPAIADRVRLPASTVRAHIRSLAEKLGVAGRVDLVALWGSDEDLLISRIPSDGWRRV